MRKIVFIGILSTVPLLFVTAKITIPAEGLKPSSSKQVKDLSVIEDCIFDSGLLLENRENIRIRNCIVSNPKGNFGIRLNNCKNVEIINCRVASIGNPERFYLENRSSNSDLDYIFANVSAKGIMTKNCIGVKILNSEIVDVFGQGIRIDGDDSRLTSDVLIEGCRIAYIYDDGIKFSCTDDQPVVVPGGDPLKLPFKGGIIRNNILHDIALGGTRLPFARHGMYLKCADVLVEGNTIFNVFYGSGISLRNAGIIRNNKIWNCVYACIAYHSQTFTTESSRVVEIVGNDCRQEWAWDIPMRHVGNPSGAMNPCAWGTIVIGFDNQTKNDKRFIEKFIIRNNKLLLYKDYPEVVGGRRVAMISSFSFHSDAVFEVKGNTLIDERKHKCYFFAIPDTTGNKFKADSKN